jgi:hypothetical protein
MAAIQRTVRRGLAAAVLTAAVAAPVLTAVTTAQAASPAKASYEKLFEAKGAVWTGPESAHERALSSMTLWAAQNHATCIELSHVEKVRSGLDHFFTSVVTAECTDIPFDPRP